MQERAVRELMTPDPLTVRPETPFKSIVRALTDAGVDAAPVVDADGRLLGVVSQSDLTCHEEERAPWSKMLLDKQAREHVRKSRGRTARELMTSPARTVAPDAKVCAALREMSDAHVSQLVVVDGGQVCGVLSRRDVLRSFLRDDAEIQRDVEQAVAQAIGDCPSRIEVEVRDGVVLLSGFVERVSCAWAAFAGAMSVSGVVDVDDELTSDIDDTEVHELSVHGPFV